MIKQRKIGKNTSDGTVKIGSTSRHVRRLWYGSSTPKPFQRYEDWNGQQSQVMFKVVLDMQNEDYIGVVRTAKYLRGAGYNISYRAR